ncbi:extracellular solute-binding protein [Wenxinia marina]|nr:extracellular solute-binding protein [Wenxinia marina]
MTVWTGSDAHLAMLNGIVEAQPGVTVSFETVPSDYVQKITLQLAGGNAPDVGRPARDLGPHLRRRRRGDLDARSDA